MAPAAEAEVIYTPAHNNVNTDFYLDLNHDGILDFHIHSSSLSGIGELEVLPVAIGNAIAATAQNCYFGRSAAAALRPGALIGPGLLFRAQANCMAGDAESTLNGPWLGVDGRYLGLAFEIDGKKHFGWVRMRVKSFFCYECTGHVLGYAYETVPGKPIVAGDQGASPVGSGALGSLALGAPGLGQWRRQDSTK